MHTKSPQAGFPDRSVTASSKILGQHLKGGMKKINILGNKSSQHTDDIHRSEGLGKDKEIDVLPTIQKLIFCFLTVIISRENVFKKISVTKDLVDGKRVYSNASSARKRDLGGVSQSLFSMTNNKNH